MACWEDVRRPAHVRRPHITKGLDESLTVSSIVLATVAAGYVLAAVSRGRSATGPAPRTVFWASSSMRAAS
jgi:hypothetical protein